ncbi:hypothetical protein GIB67_033654 [Kingdonia uniflora]|uniref:DNA polymerase III gamma subunit domain-containing protein n=1 Tax=Kingdonia uniflora TaxID=39325 RepID=A0A7J7LAV0_9MAGN|nr:hypothetical protein GIB67_033654 [Kingdonia uniflora]
MSDVLLDASDELYWKKELTALRKAARFLRDPETSSSWRSPLSSRSLAAASSLNYLNGKDGNSTRINHTARYSELEPRSPLSSAKTKKKVFLYNWRTHSSKSSDSGVKLDTYGKERSVPESPGYSLSDHAHNEGLKSDTHLGDPTLALNVKDANLQTAARKTIKKSKKNSAVSRQRFIRKSVNSKKLNLSSIDQSDDTEYCNSEDLRILAHELIRKNGCPSRSASPFLCRNGDRSHSSKRLKNVQREDSSVSCTPASTNSFCRYGDQNPSTLGSWDGASVSFDDDEVDNLDLPGRQGCGIPCYWSKRTTPKHRSCGSCYSPSFSDTLRRKGSSILCGSQTLYHKRRSLISNTRKYGPESGQGLPLLTNSWSGIKGTSIDTGDSGDELSSKLEELDLEGLSRLDGRRWSWRYRNQSQEGLELAALAGADEDSTPDHVTSLSQKYRPSFFDEIIGQNIVVQSLIKAISRGRVAPAYLFQGPRGTGKTSIARIFTAALNCISSEANKPCGSCRECSNFVCGKNTDLREVDATNKDKMDRILYLIKKVSTESPSSFSRYKVFIIDECHLLTSKMWFAFLKILEEPIPHIVFIFITTDFDNLPRTVLSQCQKFIFNKIKDTDIITRLKKLSTNENLDIEQQALDLIALNADGSLRDAETMLDQLSLLGSRITASLVNELVGVVSDEKLLDLLELALSSDTAETVKRARDLMDSGVEPMALMSQLAGLIMDIIAGTYQLVDSKCSGSFFGGRSLSEAELERLKQALKHLSDAEKQLKVSSERSTWFTAALLQLGSVSSAYPTSSSSGRKQCSKTTEEDPSSSSMEVVSLKKKPEPRYVSRKSTSSSALIPMAVDGHSSPWISGFDSRPECSRITSSITHEGTAAGDRGIRCLSLDRLDDIWARCISGCHSKTLRLLMQAHGKLLSISEVEGVLIAFVVFENGDIKSRVEKFLSSITNSIETVLRRNVEVRFGTVLHGRASNDRINPIDIPNRKSKDSVNGYSNFGSPQKRPRELLKEADFLLKEERNQEIPMQRIQAIIDEQRLESAWLQAAEKGTPASINRLKPERNQVLPQDGTYRPNQMGSIIATTELNSQNRADGLSNGIKSGKIGEGNDLQKDQSGGQALDRYPMSPSMLHSRDNFKENQGYESGTGGRGCSGLLCWKTSKRHNKGKVKQETVTARAHHGSHSSLLTQHGKSRRSESRFKI